MPCFPQASSRVLNRIDAGAAGHRSPQQEAKWCYEARAAARWSTPRGCTAQIPK